MPLRAPRDAKKTGKVDFILSGHLSCWRGLDNASAIEEPRLHLKKNGENRRAVLTVQEADKSLEAGAQMEPQAARRQLAGGLAERTVGHARVNAV